ncbi:IS66 family insertion sequence element accessory protein TnpA [Clostridium puniceum]|uniref:IS66 family insertion sequence element accessory protein TnpA n=1 Tax=Clostridium puniceum TaxID=29367 RepID=UPI003BFA6B79
MGVRPWCRENNVSEKQFYYWERRIKGKDFETQKEIESQNQANFVELQVPIDSLIDSSTPIFRTDMVIHVGNNVLEISNTVSENLLSMVLKVISNVK